MDGFFGFDRAALHDEGVSLLVTLYDDVLVGLYEELLSDAGIPVLKKDRGGGTAVRIIMGSNVQGTDLYVRDADLEKAKELIASVTEHAEAVEEDEPTEEN